MKPEIKAWVRALEMTAPIPRNPEATLPVLIDSLADRFGTAPWPFFRGMKASPIAGLLSDPTDMRSGRFDKACRLAMSSVCSCQIARRTWRSGLE